MKEEGSKEVKGARVELGREERRKEKKGEREEVEE